MVFLGTTRIISRRKAVKTLTQIAPNVQAEVFHWSVIAELMHPALHAELNALANRPILAVDQVPELYSIAGIETGLGHLIGMEKKTANHASVTCAQGPEYERSHVLWGKTEKEIGINELSLVTDSFRLT